mmetsp:Transcript_1258/g.1687  ORF Transcript_1258/g.1687 Transcript_1258/m.1687 type:complete len:145 (-) Transcript_1258:2-436(-)
MDRVEADATPAEEWEASLNATCNRMNTQYLNLIRAATGSTDSPQGDPRSGGGVMKSLQEPPPTVAADAILHEMQAKLAVENISVASSHLLELIRTLRLSVLLMDEDTIAAEEEYQVLESQKITVEAEQKAKQMEVEWMKLRNQI